MRDIPDAPWIGKCREDYYGYEDEDEEDDFLEEEEAEDDESYE